MKLVVSKDKIGNPLVFMRKAGYGAIHDSKTGQDSFVRRLGANFYPRFHVYVLEEEGGIIFNLHLDQKQASYPGAHKHNAEYEGDLVEREINRLKQLTEKQATDSDTSSKPEEQKKGWIKKLFS